MKKMPHRGREGVCFGRRLVVVLGVSVSAFQSSGGAKGRAEKGISASASQVDRELQYFYVGNAATAAAPLGEAPDMNESGQAVEPVA